jgi:hypothetical protein
MKTLGRIAIILLAALVVAGATVAFTQTSVASSVVGRDREDHIEQRVPRAQTPAGQFPGEFRRAGHNESFTGISLLTLGPIIKDIAIMAGIAVMVIAATLMLRTGKRANKPAQTVAAGSEHSQQALNSSANIHRV